MPKGAILLHGELLLLVLGGYILLTALGHDGTALLGVLGGQAAGGVIQALTIGGR